MQTTTSSNLYDSDDYLENTIREIIETVSENLEGDDFDSADFKKQYAEKYLKYLDIEMNEITMEIKRLYIKARALYLNKEFIEKYYEYRDKFKDDFLDNIAEDRNKILTQIQNTKLNMHRLELYRNDARIYYDV